MKPSLPLFAIVPATSREGQEVCVYCSHPVETGRALCPSCGKRPFLTEARQVLLWLAVGAFFAGMATSSWMLYALSFAFFAGGTYLQSRPQAVMQDNRRVFLPLAAMMYLMIPATTGSLTALVLSLLATAFTYFALPTLHSPWSLDTSRSIDEFEARHQLGYGFGGLREQVRSTIAASDEVKRELLARELLPRIDRLIDDKLLSVLRRKVNLERIVAMNDPARLEEERKRAMKRASTVKNDAVRGELTRSAALSRSMIENYQRIIDLLNVYNVQITNLQKVLSNLNMKVAATAFDDGSLGALREPLDALDREMDLLESSFKAIDLSLDG